MNDMRCPNCNHALTLAELSSDWCENCGKKIPAFIRSSESPASASPALLATPITPSARSADADDYERTSSRPFDSKKIVGGLVLAFFGLVVAGGVLYLVLGPDATIYVDNGGKEPITVFMDGVQKITVPPGQVDSFSCRKGLHQFTARRGESVVFDEAKMIENKGSGRQKYLLDPEATHRYRVKEVQYGMAIPSVMNYHDDEDLARQTAEHLNLVPPVAWIDVSPDLVLEKPPDKVSGEVLSSRKVLVRVSKADADYISTTLARWDAERNHALDPAGDVTERMTKYNEQKRARQADYSQVKDAVERIAKSDD